MADSENIGGIDVSIGADYSQLTSDFTTVQSQAAAAGEKIADSFNQTAATGTDALTQSMSGLAEQMAAVGEALAITEGMIELGEEALTAADSITTASIALTKMSGSATEAHETIEGLEQLGMSDGLSMPSLLTAAQRMTSLLPEGTDVVSVLAQIADGAAVMGSDVGSAANAFDRIVASGTTSARQLLQLGISLDSLSGAFNTVTGGANSTADSVAAMMKQLDDNGRIAVLRQALTALGGTAEQVANQTFGGQWQQLANAWEGTMVQVGQVLLPVISDLASFAKTDIVPFLQEVVADFKALPEPIQYAVSSIALLVAAVVPLSAGAAALAIGINGTITALTELGLISEKATVDTEAVGVAVAETGAVAAEAVPELDAIAESLLAIAAASDEAAVQYDLFASDVIAANWGAEATQLNLFADAEAGLATEAALADTAVVGAGSATGGFVAAVTAAAGPVTLIAGALGVLSGALLAWIHNNNATAESNQELQDSVDDLEKALEAHGISVSDLNQKYMETNMTLPELLGHLQALDQGYQDSVTRTTSAANNTILLAGALKTLTDETQKNQTAYSSALAVYQAVQTALQNGTVLYNGQKATLADLTQATENLVSAAAKVPEGQAAVSTALAADSIAAEKATLNYQALSGAYQSLLASGTATAGQLATALQKMEAAEASAATAGVPVAGSLQAIDVQANAAINSSKLLATNFGVLSDMATAQTDALSDNDAQVAILSQKLDLLVTSQQNVAAKVAAGTAQYSQQVEIQKQVVTTAGQLQDALDKQAVAQANAGNQAAIAGGNVGVLKQELDNANIALDQATQKADAGTISIGAWAAAQKVAATAAINLGEAAGEAKSGMQGSTDALSLLGTEAGGATGKLQALTQAYKDGLIGPKEYSSGVTDALNAQIAFDGQRAISDAGLATSTTQWGLLQAAVLLAKAKVDDLTTAQSQGIPVQEQLTQATADLKTKQDAYNTAVSASHTPLGNASTDVKNLTSDATNAIPVMGELGVAMGNVGIKAAGMASSVAGAATSIEGALNAVNTAINSVAGNAAGFSGTGRVTETGFGSFGQPIYSVNSSLPPEGQLKQAMQEALAAADQSSNPKGSTSAAAIAQEALAEALATVQVDEQFFGQTSSTGSQLVSVSTLQSAQSAVATAQQAVGALAGTATTAAATATQALNSIYSSTGSSTGLPTTGPTDTTGVASLVDPVSAAQAVIAALNSLPNGGGASDLAIAIDKLEDIVANGGGLTVDQVGQLQSLLNQAGLTANGTWASGSTPSTGTGTSSSSPDTAATSSGSEDTSSYGGSYPGVVAHQAAGEVWVVDTSGVASGSSGGTATAAGSTDATSALAATSTADAVASAADTIATVVSQLGLISQSTSQLGAGQYGALDNAAVATGGTTGLGSVTSATGYFAVNGIVVYLVAGQPANGDYNGLSFVNGVATGVAAGAAASSGPIGNYSGTLPATGGTFTPGGNPAGPTVPVTPPQAQVPGVTAAAVGSGGNTISVAVDMRGAMVGNQAQMLQMVTAAVQKGLTQNLFQAGARLTQA